MLEIFIINALSDNYVYLLRNEHKNLTSVIDPGESEPVLRFLNNKNWHLDEIVNTHYHHDQNQLELYQQEELCKFFEQLSHF